MQMKLRIFASSMSTLLLFVLNFTDRGYDSKADLVKKFKIWLKMEVICGWCFHA